jgi:hypothetical protein
MSLISFPFDFGLLKNNIFNDATPSSYVPPGYSSGLRATYSYTVPASTKTLVNFNLNASGIAQFLGTNKDVRNIFNRSMTLTFPGATNDLFVGFSESYSNTTNMVCNFVILKNGISVFSLTESYALNGGTPITTANLLIQCLEYNQ